MCFKTLAPRSESFSPEGQEFPQGLQAAGDEKVRFRIPPASQDVVGRKGDSVGKVHDHDAFQEFLALPAVQLGQACGQQIHRAIEQFALGIKNPEAYGLQPRQASYDRL